MSDFSVIYVDDPYGFGGSMDITTWMDSAHPLHNGQCDICDSFGEVRKFLYDGVNMDFCGSCYAEVQP